MKIAKEPLGDTVDPDIDRDGIPEFTEDTLAFLREGIPEMAEGKVVGGRSCLYTATPDDHFMVDRVPAENGYSSREAAAGTGSSSVAPSGR